MKAYNAKSLLLLGAENYGFDTYLSPMHTIPYVMCGDTVYDMIGCPTIHFLNVVCPTSLTPCHSLMSQR